MSEGKWEPVEVRTYSGYKADERPTSLVVNGRRLKIIEVIDRWRQAGIDPAQGTKTYFRVKGEDGRVYTLFQDQRSGHWFWERG